MMLGSQGVIFILSEKIKNNEGNTLTPPTIFE